MPLRCRGGITTRQHPVSTTLPTTTTTTMGAFAGDLDSGPVISNSPQGASRLPLRSTHAHQGRSGGMLSMAAETGKRGAVLAEPSPSSALFVVGLSSARGQLPRLVFPPATFGRPGRPTQPRYPMAGKRHSENVTSTRHMTSATCQGHGKPLSGDRDWTYDVGMVTMPLPLWEPPVSLCPSCCPTSMLR